MEHLVFYGFFDEITKDNIWTVDLVPLEFIEVEDLKESFDIVACVKSTCVW